MPFTYWVPLRESVTVCTVASPESTEQVIGIYSTLARAGVLKEMLLQHMLRREKLLKMC